MNSDCREKLQTPVDITSVFVFQPGITLQSATPFRSFPSFEQLPCRLQSNHMTDIHFFASIFHFLPFVQYSRKCECINQACPVDLTRTIAGTTPNTDKATCRKLAFSVENILDPNKFCSRKESQNSTRLWLNGSFERDDRNHMDDDQSESQSG